MAKIFETEVLDPTKLSNITSPLNLSDIRGQARGDIIR